MSEEIILKLESAEMEDRVWEYLAEKSNITDKRKLERLNELSNKAKKHIEDRIDARAIMDVTEDFHLEGSSLIINGTDVGGIGINHIDENKISKIYTFVLCVGEYELDIDPITDVFCDLWGTAYADCALDILREKVSEREKSNVSPAFGPGFYEMGIDTVKKIFELVSPEKIGVILKNTVMVPLKSYAGFFLVSSSDTGVLAKDCSSCIGNKLNCNYCRNFSK